MDAQRWEQIRALFDEVVDADGSERASRLAVIGTTDPALRAAVDDLLKADADADAVLASVESPFGVTAAPHEARARRLGQELRTRLQSALGDTYRIERELRGGGMSCVFVAEETAFHRPVVIKVLRPDLAQAVSAKRFQREIQLAARLQHPHIVPLLIAGEAEGLLYYTMPFVDGENLRDRLRREGELPIDDAVRILRDVVGALAYAHRNGIVHRDIKPENILLADGGAVVADFGIAKALSSSSAHGAGIESTGITERGLAVGTPLYMAPEQAADDSTVDHRADLYALGAVAYEMLAGKPPFHGRSSQEVMAAHAVQKPVPVGQYRPRAPDGLTTLVMRCLEKRPADRPANAEQVLAVLERGGLMSADSVPVSWAVGGRAAMSWRRPMFLLAGAVVAVLAGVSAGLAITRSRPDQPTAPAWFDLALPDSAIPTTPYDPGDASIALSPDGSTVAFVGGATRSVFVRPLDERLPRRLEDTEGTEPCVSFSPDGEWLLFISSFRLRKIAIRGGSPITIADSAASCQAWTERNDILFIWRNWLYRVSANGGPVSLVTRGDSALGVVNVVATDALPGGNAVLACLNNASVGVVALPSGRITSVTDGRLQGCPARYADGHLLFARNRTLYAAPFSLRSRRVTAPEVPLVRDSVASFSTGGNTLAYVASPAPRSFAFVAVGEGGRMRVLGGRDRDLDSTRRLSEPRRALTPLDTAYYAWPRLSPDGKRFVMELFGNPGEGIWVYHIASRTLSRLNTRSRGIQPTGWTSDSRNVIYVQIDSGNFADRNEALRLIGGRRRIVSQPWDGSAPARELIQFPERFSGSINTLFDISMGPAHVAFVVGNFSDTADIWIAPLDSPSKAWPLVVSKSREYQPRLSPDGNFVAYTTDETGREEVSIRSVRGPATLLQVSTGGGREPLWSRDGRALFYRAPGVRGPSHVMRATLARDAELTVARRDTLFADVFNGFDVANYAVFPGDKELLMIIPNQPPVHAAVAVNWAELFLAGKVAR